MSVSMASKLKLHIALGVTALSASVVAHADEDVRWREQVKLSDGRIIEIQRHVELTSSGFPLQKRGFTKYYEICYPPMGIHWKSRGGYQPDIFDIVDGKAYMHVPVTSQQECYEQGSPATGAIYFVWDSGVWKRIEHDEFPAAFGWNLLMQTNRGSPETDPQGLITIEDKLDSNGKWADTSLLREQKRFGWKRVNESYARREGCARWSKGPGGCADASCTRWTASPIEPFNIFYKDVGNTCQP